MTKSKEPARGKGKGVASSSSTPVDKRASKKRKTGGVQIRDEAAIWEERERRYDEFIEGQANVPRTAFWVKGSLNRQDEDFQTKFFYEQYKDERTIQDNMCLEKAVNKEDFKALGFDEKFRALGWEAVEDFKGNKHGYIYLRSVIAWLSTLTRDDGNDPPRTITLTGKVDGKPVVLSRASIKRLARFDSKPDDFYQYINEKDYFEYQMNLLSDFEYYDELFLMEDGFDMVRDELKPLVRVLLNFVVHNVAPRLGDRMHVRSWELPVLYAIMTGELHLSFCQLVIMHVWQARNMKSKKLIPHARLLSYLLEKNGATLPGDGFWTKPHVVFGFRELGKINKWSYVKTRVWHKLKLNDGRQVKVLQEGKEAPEAGEIDDLDSSDEEMMRRRRERGLVAEEGENQAMPTPVQIGYSWGVFDDDMQARVESSRPPEYDEWTSFERISYDQNTIASETRTREHNEALQHMTRLDRMRFIQGEVELNMRAYDENQMRAHMDYYQGVSRVAPPSYVDYSTLAPYQQGEPRLPMPQAHGSMWLPNVYTAPHYQSSYPYRPPPYEYQQPQQPSGTGGSGDIFDMSSFYEHLGNYSGGPPGPSYR